MTRNVSSLHGLRSSRADFELTISVQQAVQLQAHLRWVNGTAQLADGLTKNSAAAKKGILEFLARGQRWSVVHDPSYTAGKKLTKAQLNKQLIEKEAMFEGSVRAFALESHYPWLEDCTDLDTDLEPQNFKEALGM